MNCSKFLFFIKNPYPTALLRIKISMEYILKKLAINGNMRFSANGLGSSPNQLMIL